MYSNTTSRYIWNIWWWIWIIFREIYIKASVDVCSKRDVKGLYARAKRGEIKNFTGISSPYEEPEKPSLIIDTSKEAIEKSVDKLEKYILSQFSF